MRTSRLVIDHEPRTAYVVDAIHPQADCEPADVPGHFALGLDDGKRITRAVERNKAVARPELPITFQGARTRARGNRRKFRNRIVDASFHAAAACGRREAEQSRLRAEARPEAFQSPMQDLAAQPAVEPG